MLDVYVHNFLSMKRFHEALTGNVPECSLESRVGKARINALIVWFWGTIFGHWFRLLRTFGFNWHN